MGGRSGRARCVCAAAFRNTTRSTRCTVGTPHVIIGTPGRLNGMLQAPGALRLTRVRVLVLDEVDMMLDMG